jgi:hypothetical protein
MAITIHVPRRKPFRCPPRVTATEAAREIRAVYNLRHGGIIRDGYVLMLDEIISEGGTYEFVNFRVNPKRTSSSTLKELDAFLNFCFHVFSTKKV